DSQLAQRSEASSRLTVRRKYLPQRNQSSFLAVCAIDPRAEHLRVALDSTVSAGWAKRTALQQPVPSPPCREGTRTAAPLCAIFAVKWCFPSATHGSAGQTREGGMRARFKFLAAGLLALGALAASISGSATAQTSKKEAARPVAQTIQELLSKNRSP